LGDTRFAQQEFEPPDVGCYTDYKQGSIIGIGLAL